MGSGASVQLDDPWHQLAGFACLQAIDSEEGDTVAIEDVNELTHSLSSVQTQHGVRLVLNSLDLGEKGSLSEFQKQFTPLTPSITSLSLSSCGLSSLEEIHLEHMDHLRHLDLSGNSSLKIDVLSPVMSCAKLVDLDLSYCEDLNLASRRGHSLFEGIGCSLLRLNLCSVSLASLTCRGLSEPSDESPTSVLSGLTSLVELSLAENHLRDLNDLIKGLESTPVLEVLELQDNPISENPGYATDEFIAQLNLSNLKQFDLKSLRKMEKVIDLSKVIPSQATDFSGMVLGDAAAVAALETEVLHGLEGKVDTTAIS